MRKWVVLAVASAMVVLSFAIASPAVPNAGKRGCATINLGGPKIFTKHNMRCEKAKRKAERVYRTRGDHEPRNFSCTSGSNFEDGGFCQHDSKDKYFGWHPAD